MTNFLSQSLLIASSLGLFILYIVIHLRISPLSSCDRLPVDQLHAARHENTLGISSLHLLADQKPDSAKFWVDDDPQVCVLVSTYSGHGLSLLGLATSLLSSAYPFLDLILLDTEPRRDSTTYLEATAHVINEMTLGLTGRKVAHISPLAQKHIIDHFPSVTAPDYGYILSDLLMQHSLHKGTSDMLADVPPCDYFLLTNGDNLYSPYLMPSLLKYLRAGVDLIGFDFTSHYQRQVKKQIGDMTKTTILQHQTLHCQFKVSHIDKGAALIRAKTLWDLDATLVLHLLRDNPTLQEKPKGRPNEVRWADGYFYQDFAQRPEVTSVIVPENLFMHL
ncbi:unnamed protein product [Chrysoparadoxa australica]